MSDVGKLSVVLSEESAVEVLGLIRVLLECQDTRCHLSAANARVLAAADSNSLMDTDEE